VAYLVAFVAVYAAAAALLPAPHGRRLLRRAPAIVLAAVVAAGVMWVTIRVIPGPDRVTRLPVGQSVREYVEWLGDAVTGDLGFSRGYSEPVVDGLARTIPISLQLTLYSQIVGLAVAVPLAMLAVRFERGLVDRTASTGSLLLLSTPPIVIAPLLIATFALGGIDFGPVRIGTTWFPPGLYTPPEEGFVEHFRSVALPTLSLAAGLVAPYFVIVRNALSGALRQDYALGAAAKGLPPRRVLRNHGLPVALPLLVSVVGAQLAVLVGNLVVIEHIFSFPGFSDYALVALGRRDLAPMAASIGLLAAALTAVHLMADALVAARTPSATPDG
jgi:peptide/nickel transport system permease protein